MDPPFAAKNDLAAAIISRRFKPMRYGSAFKPAALARLPWDNAEPVDIEIIDKL